MSVLETESLFLTVVVQLLIIVAAARAGGWLFIRLGQPRVVGEIAAGLLLGPSVLGALAPELSGQLFPDAARSSIHTLGQLGLVLLMFLVGLEFDFGHLRRLGRAATAVSLAGIALPFGAGLAVARLIHPHVAPGVPPVTFMLFVAVALSITAIPILGRIIVDLGLERTRLAALTMSAAAVDDVLGWILLAAVTAAAQGSFEPASTLRTLVLVIALALAVWFVARPLVVAWSRRVLAAGAGHLEAGPLAILLMAILGAAALSSWIGIFALFGPFLLGAALWDQEELRLAIRARLWDFVHAFFLPVFFTSTGLHTDFGFLDSALLWGLSALVCLAAVGGKMIGCGVAARLGGMSPRESWGVAVMMNTRALMGLVAIHVGREMGVVTDAAFSMLVLMALLTTFMTTPLLRLILGDEIGPARGRSGGER